MNLIRFAPAEGSDLDLWQLTRHCFERDDGSLPEVRFFGMTPRQVAACRRMILGLGATPTESTSDDVTVSTLRLERALVGTETLPNLNFFLSPDSVSVDWRMGSDWTPARVIALFKLLEDIRAIAPASQIDFFEHPDPSGFQTAWKLIQAS